MDKILQAIIKKWVEDNQDWGWKVDGLFLWRQNNYYQTTIELFALKNCCIESGELCLAFKGGQLVWLMEDSISSGYSPKNPLFKDTKIS